MVWRYVKAQLMVLLCGGLVGPIFLAVFFATGQDPLLKWMFWVGLLVTGLDVLIALGLAGYGAKAQEKSTMLEANGVLALARITGITETGTRINDQPLVKLGLRIEGAGIAPFDAQDSVLASISRLPMLTGRQLVAVVDPHTQSFQIDWNRSALVSGAVPAQFTIAEDDRTYDLSGQPGPLMEILTILKAHGVPMTGTIDIRSNPAVRQQVINVVRRASAQQAPPQTPAAAPAMQPTGPYAAPSVTTSQRLQELETLRATGTISESEYAAKRQQIIADL